MGNRQPTAFERGQRQEKTGLVREFLLFLKHNRKFWLIPLLLLLGLLGILLVLGGTGAAPFIYTLF
jgi:hypothetical protein